MFQVTAINNLRITKKKIKIVILHVNIQFWQNSSFKNLCKYIVTM